jgi:tetratricopeptide (TPR) repeat protein/TM2 domain-containing membrane protein YozV
VLGANFLLVTVITILAGFVLFSLSLAAKYVLVASNDLRERFGWDMPLLLFSVFIAVLLVFLFSLDIGLLWVAIIVNMAFLIYYTKTEKRILAVFYALIIASPIILNYTSALMLSTHRDAIAEMIQVREDIYTQQTEKTLVDWSDDNPDDVYALFTLGLLNKRIGYLDHARRYYEKAIELRPSFAPALNNLGVIYFILKDYNRAEELFTSANAADPDLVAPYYNLYKIGMTRFDLKTAEEYYDQAMSRSPDRITKFLDIEIKENEGEPSLIERTNRMVIDEDLTDSILWGRIFTMTEPKELAKNLFGDMMKGVGLRAAPFFGIAGLVLLLISGSLAQRMLLSKYCRFCGLPFLLKSQSHLERRDSCNRCFSVFVRKEGVDPRTKADLRMKVDRINYLRRIALIVTSLVIPGFGRIYRGKVWRGFVFLSLFLIFFVQFLTPHGIVTYPISSAGLPIIHNRYLYGIACAIIYILAQRDLIKSESSEA